jgi:hypothetical protein
MILMDHLKIIHLIVATTTLGTNNKKRIKSQKKTITQVVMTV